MQKRCFIVDYTVAKAKQKIDYELSTPVEIDYTGKMGQKGAGIMVLFLFFNHEVSIYRIAQVYRSRGYNVVDADP